MPSALDPVILSRALTELGVTPGSLRAIREAPPDKGPLLVEELKHVAKSRFRQRVKELHPDQTGGDTTKAAWFSVLCTVMKQVDEMVYRQPPPPPPPMMQSPHMAAGRVVFRAVPMTSIYRAGVPQPGARPDPSRTPPPGTPSTTSAPGGIPRPLRVVFMRPY